MNNSSQNILKQYVLPYERLIVGVSGGPDSVYLLLQTLKYTKGIIIAHVNHKTRGRSSDKDALFVASLAKNLGLPFEQKTLEPQKKEGNLEDYFRNERYAFFEALRKKHKARWVLTAHHLNDNIETVLFNLAKGSFLDGLSGMKMADTKRHLLRPLLFTTKDEILRHLNKTRTPYRKDKTNKNIAYSRNRVRHKVVPQLKTINRNLEQTFAHNIVNLQELRAYLDEVTAGWLEQNCRHHYIRLANFLQLHPVIQKSVMQRLYENLCGTGRKLNQSHLEQLLKIIHQKNSNRKKEFGDHHFLSITGKGQKKVISITEKA